LSSLLRYTLPSHSAPTLTNTQVLIVDDRIALIGSANLNDRSQVGDHDSEIACIIEDSNLVDSVMDGRPFKAGRFATSLRRTLFRKHLGLLKPQNYEAVEDPAFYPVSSGFGPAAIGASENEYDFGSVEDIQVQDPLDVRFETMWNSIAHNNTEVFAKVFHPVPYDGVRTWAQYEDWYEKYFRSAETNKDVKDGKKPPGKYLQCHVVSESFPGGVEEVKTELAKVRGTLVEMPLVFLKDEDIAKEGLGLNAFTEEVYT
jgi:phospholipase D1/2